MRGVPAACVCLTAKEVFGHVLEFGEAVETLRRFHLESALSSLAMLNAGTSAMIAKPRLDNKAKADQLRGMMHFLFDGRPYEAAENVARGQVGQLFVPVSPQACVAMTEACLRYSSANGGRDVSQPSETPSFGHVLLTFQEFMMPAEHFGPNIDFTKLTDRQFALLTCNYMAANLVRFLGARPTRFFLMFEEALAQSEMVERTGLTSRQWFDRVMGLDPLFFRVLALSIFGIAHKFSIERPDGRQLVVNFDRFLGKLKPPVQSLYREILDRSVVDLADIPKLPEVVTWEDALYRFNYLRRKPLWKMRRGDHLLLHQRFFVEKFFEGVHHLRTETAIARVPHGWSSSPGPRVAKVRSDYGYVFDDYCRSTLRVLFSANAQPVLKFGYKLNGQERDGLVALPGVVLLFEFFQHPISVVERETGEMARFLAHLSDNVLKLASVRDAILTDQPVADMVFSDQTIIPIVVSSETFPISHLNAEAFWNGLVALVGSDAVNAKSRSLPVQTLGIEQLESLGRTTPAEKGAAGIAEFLGQRARDPLERVAALPTCGLAGGKANLWDEFDAKAERTMAEQSALLFRPETLPADWHLGWRRRHPVTGVSLADRET